MKDFKCEFCKFCIEQDKLHQIGLCVEEHSPKNAKGEARKTVRLWSLGCSYKVPVDPENTAKVSKSKSGISATLKVPAKKNVRTPKTVDFQPKSIDWSDKK